MREKLEVKILVLVVVLLMLGILAAGFMVLTMEKNQVCTALQEKAQRQPQR